MAGYSKYIDLNCDIGEGVGNDELIMPFISSANIACGYHAGDTQTIWKTIELAIKHNVAVGAHVSFLDKENFGRTEMDLSSEDIYELVTQQLILFKEVADSLNIQPGHVKPHGALYNMSAKNRDIAEAIANAVMDFDDDLVLFGLSGSYSIKAAQKKGLKTANEVFADRTYQDDGSLTPRTSANALIADKDQSFQQVFQMINEKTVTAVSGKKIAIDAETICIHGDGIHAVEFAEYIYQGLIDNKIGIEAKL